jgi:membrane protein required for colicin V production
MGRSRVNWVDLVVIGIVAVSALLALLRGFVREVLSIAAWLGAFLFARWGFPYARPRFHDWFTSPDVADAAAFGALFLFALILLSIVSSMIGRLVHTAGLGGLDRTLGVVFGLVRGAALIAAAYIGAGLAVPVERWPPALQEARSLPIAYEGAVWAVSLLPPEYRPAVRPPPAGRETRAEDLLRASPLGRATGTP